MLSQQHLTLLKGGFAGSTLNHWPFPSNHLAEGYAYLLTHPGTPCVFYDHFFDKGPLGETIVKLIDIRQRNGINSRSKVCRFDTGSVAICSYAARKPCHLL